MKLTNLEKLLGTIAGSIPLAEALFYKNSAPHTSAERLLGTADPLMYNPMITPYVGNFPETFTITALSGFVGDYIEIVGKERKNYFLEKTGKYFPKIMVGAISTYFSLGETVLPQILPGKADVKDVPAVLITALAGYILAKLSRKSGLNERMYKMANLLRQ